jgi:hypothetical protein
MRTDAEIDILNVLRRSTRQTGPAGWLQVDEEKFIAEVKAYAEAVKFCRCSYAGRFRNGTCLYCHKPEPASEVQRPIGCLCPRGYVGVCHLCRARRP